MMFFVRMNSLFPLMPPARPKPLCLMPPKGSPGGVLVVSLTTMVPV